VRHLLEHRPVGVIEAAVRTHPIRAMYVQRVLACLHLCRPSNRRLVRRKECSMRAAQDYDLQGGYGRVPDYSDPAGVGWVTFATVLLGLAGIWNFVDGILAISSAHVYTASSTFVFSDLNTWGWIVMILGIIEGLAALAILSGSEFARWFGIGAASLNAIGQLMFIPVYPWWGLAMFSVDILIIYARAVYGGRRLQGAV
jgi:hypothetical protein